MVPWPIALLTLFYGVIAAASAVTAWRVVAGVIDRPLIWPAGWLVLSASVMCGLPLLRRWARALAVITSALMVLVALSMAGVFVMAGHPLGAVLATVGAGMHLVIIRYLRRPHVRAYFDGCATSSPSAEV